MLRVTYSHRLEELVQALADELAAARRDGSLTLFDPVTIVVPHRAVAAYVERGLARALGVAANLRFPFLDSFLAAAAAEARPDARVIDRPLLRVLVARALGDEALLARPEMAAPAAYLAAPDGDAWRLRLELADELAALFIEYELGRPDWLAAWRRGEPAAVPDAARDDERWQRAIWRAVLGDGGLAARLGGKTPWASAATLLEQAPAAALRLPGRTALVGFHHLAPRQLALLGRLAANDALALLLPNPCREFWDDVGEDPLDAPLLALWGRARRELVRLVADVGERAGHTVDERFPDPGEPSTALAALQRAVLERARVDEAGPRFTEPAIEIVSAPGVRRELEVIADRIWALVAADPTLRLDQIAIFLAGSERSLYQSHLPSVFHERCDLPHHMIDLPLGRGSRVAEGVSLLLGVLGGRLTRAEMAGVLLHPSVLAGVPGADGEAWLGWFARLGIVHGGDRADHAGTYIDQDVFNWDQGLRRLALGAVMEGERSGALRAVAIGADRYLAEEISTGEAAAAAALTGLVRRIVAASREAARPRALAAWARFADGLVTGLVHPEEEADEQALGRCRAAIAGLTDLDLDGEAVPWSAARQLIDDALCGLRGATGDLLCDGVLVAPLGHAPLPFRVVFVAGLGEGRFPGREPGGLDLRASERRVGDLSPRDRDLGALLDAVLGARERLVLSFVGHDEKTGDVVGCSSALLDLADVVRAHHDGDLEDRHPLRRYDARYFPGGAAAAGAPVTDPIGERQARARALRADLERHWRARGGPAPGEEAIRRALAGADDELRRLLGLEAIAGGAAEVRRELQLHAVRRFLEDPVQAWAAAVLGVADDEDDDGRDLCDEPIERGNLEAATLVRDVVGAFLLAGGGDVDTLQHRHRERAARLALAGLGPVGRLGAIQRSVDEEMLGRLHRALVEVGAAGATRGAIAGRALAFGRVRTGAVVSERRPALAVPCGEGMIELHGACHPCAGAAGLVVVVTSKKVAFRHRLRGALELVAMAAGGALEAGRHAFTVISCHGAVERHALELEPVEAAAYLGRLAAELTADAHDYVLPGAAAWSFLTGKKQKPLDALVEAELAQAENLPWSAGPVARLERLALPPDAEDVARRRLGWLAERMEAIK